MDPSLIWIPATLAAAAAQTARNAMQHRLTETLGTIGATQVRFLYGLPFSLLFLALLSIGTGEAVPRATPDVLLWTLTGALAQIVATALMLSAMSLRSFGTAIAYTKTEPVQVAVFGLVFLGDRLTILGGVAVVVATIGIVMLSGRPGGVSGRRTSPFVPAAMGIAAGACFALAAVAFRGAITALPDGTFLMRATVTLAWSLAMQAAILAVWLLLVNRAALFGSLRIWRSSLFAGFMGALASQCWFTGFSVTAAANVRTLGLVEVLFAAIVTRRLFAQTISWREWAGYALVCGGVGLLVYGAA